MDMAVLVYIMYFSLGLWTELVTGDPGYMYKPEKPKDYCPAPKESEAPSNWTITPANLDFACDKEYKELHCCVNTYTQILWYKQNGDTWTPLNFNQHHYEGYNHNQTVKIKSAIYKEDMGNFKCAVFRISQTRVQEKVLQNELYLDIQENCSNWHRKPTVSLPLNNVTNKMATEGSNVSFVCQGFFGICYEDICSVDWLNATLQVIDSQGNGRVHTVIANTSGDSSQLLRRNTLYIDNVQASDYGQYVCSVSSSYGEEKRYISLSRYVAPTPPSEGPLSSSVRYSIYALVPVVAIGIILGAVAGYFKKTLDGRLKWKQQFGGYPDDRRYHVTLIYHTIGGEVTEDEEFAEGTLSRILQETYHYQVFDQRNIDAGETEQSAIGHAVENSHCVLFVISPDFIHDPNCLSVYANVQNEVCQHIYVKHVPISEEEEQRFCQQQRAKNPDNTPEVLFRSITTGQTITWPTDEEAKNIKSKRSDFWKQLQLFLPNVRANSDPEKQLSKQQQVHTPSTNHRERVRSGGSETPLFHRGNSDCSYRNEDATGVCSTERHGFVV